jgi:putative DNA primase/helicase
MVAGVRGQLGATECTEDGLRYWMEELGRGFLKFDVNDKHWFVRDKHVWRRDDMGQVNNWTARLRRTIAGAATGKVPLGFKSHRVSNAVETQLRTGHKFAVQHDVWDRAPWLFAAPDGVYDLTTGERVPDEVGAKGMLVRMTSVSPAPQGTPTPIWNRVLDEAMLGDQSLVEFIHTWGGYNLSADISWGVFVLMWGTGRNGKGVIMGTTAEIYGDYARTVPAEVFMERKHEAHSTELARLAGARMALMSESDEGRRFNLSRVKALSSPDHKITARFLYENDFEFVASHKHTFVTNAKPVLAHVDPAITARLLLLPFLFRPAVADPRLKERLRPEYPGILRKLMEGAQRAYRAVQNGNMEVLVPAKVKAASEDYFASQDAVTGWMQERVVMKAGATIGVRAAFKDHQDWAHREGRAASLGEKAFVVKMQELFPSVRKIEKNVGYVFEGVELKLLPQEMPTGSAF